MSRNPARSPWAISAVAVASAFFGSQAGATTVTLESTGNVTTQTAGQQVENYFNGGTDQFNQTGPSDAAIFPTVVSGNNNTTLFDLASKLSGSGAGKAQNVPSGNAYVLYQPLTSTMNIAPGFAITSLSFDYSDISTNSLDSTVVTVWSGTGGTGTALATLSLGGNSPLFGTAGSACTLSQAEFCTWSLATASFSGLAESVTFGTPPTSGNSAIALTEFDSITMNVVPVPIPASLPLLLFGVAGFGALLRRKLTAA